MPNDDPETTPAQAGHVCSTAELGVRHTRRWSAIKHEQWDDPAFISLMRAIPAYPEPAMSTMEIWLACTSPKPAYSRAKVLLKRLSETDLGCERTGGSVGAQFYRWIG